MKGNVTSWFRQSTQNKDLVAQDLVVQDIDDEGLAVQGLAQWVRYIDGKSEAPSAHKNSEKARRAFRGEVLQWTTIGAQILKHEEELDEISANFRYNNEDGCSRKLACTTWTAHLNLAEVSIDWNFSR